MRHEVLYQYDLPVEIMDAIPKDEEVFDVVYARAKSKILIPILLTQERILWAYPETVAAYHIYEMQYVDIVTAKARITTALPSTLTIQTVNNRTFRFTGIRNNARSIRKALFTICNQLKERLSDAWTVTENKTLLYDEYILGKNPESGNRAFSESNDSDIFEDGPIPGSGCFESNEKIFSHFPGSGDDVFEEKPVPCNFPEEIKEDAGAKSKVARIVDSVKEEIRKINETNQEKKKKKEMEPDDSIVYSSDSGKTDDQWHEEITGDAMILPKRKPWKAILAQKQQPPREYGPEDDDSVILGDESEKDTKKEEPVNEKKPEYRPEDDDSVIYEMNSDIPMSLRPNDITYPHETTLDKEGRVLHIADNVNFEEVDKILANLKAQRDAKEITEEEYKARSLRLFKEGR